MNHEEKIGAGPVPETAGAPIFPGADFDLTEEDLRCRPPFREPAPVLSTGKDAVFALLFFICGYCFVWLVHPFRLGFGATVFTVLFCLVALAYQKSRGVSLSGEGIFWFAAMLISGANFSLLSNVFLQSLNLLLLMSIAVYWAAVLNSTRLEPSLGGCFPADMVNQLFQVPFRNFGCAVKVLRNETVKSRKSKTLFAVACGVFAAVPILCLVFSQLIQADAGFQALTQRIADSMGTGVIEFLLRLLPAFLVGSYLFGLWYGNLQKRYVGIFTAESAKRFFQRQKKLPPALSLTVLFLLGAVYLWFLGFQAVTLFSAVQNHPSEGFTYAEFARRGFFELCRVVMINLTVMLAAFFFTRSAQRQKTMRLMNVVLSVETLMLIATALGKMMLYIAQYGMTQKRVYTSCFMIVLFLIFCLVIFAQFRKINLTRSVVALCCVSFLALCYVNADGWIAQYNVDRYLNGSLKHVDVAMMYSAPDASVPAALQLYRQTDDPRVKTELKQFFRDTTALQIPFEEQNLQRIRAQESIAQMK